MGALIAKDRDLLDLVIPGLLFIALIAIACALWFNARAAAADHTVAALAKLSHAAADYALGMVAQGATHNPDGTILTDDEVLDDAQATAAFWLQAEARRVGIRLDAERTQQWAVLALERRMHEEVTMPTIPQLLPVQAVCNGSGQLASLPDDIQGSTDQRLKILAQRAVQFMDDLRNNGQLRVRPSNPDIDIDTDVAGAWLMTEVAKRALPVSSDSIANALKAALEEAR